MLLPNYFNAYSDVRLVVFIISTRLRMHHFNLISTFVETFHEYFRLINIGIIIYIRITRKKNMGVRDTVPNVGTLG